VYSSSVELMPVLSLCTSILWTFFYTFADLFITTLAFCFHYFVDFLLYLCILLSYNWWLQWQCSMFSFLCWQRSQSLSVTLIFEHLMFLTVRKLFMKFLNVVFSFTYTFLNVNVFDCTYTVYEVFECIKWYEALSEYMNERKKKKNCSASVH